MAFIAVIPLVIVAVFAFLTAADPALHARVMQTIADAGLDLQLLGARVVQMYEQHLQPKVRKLAVAALVALVAGGVIPPMLCGVGREQGITIVYFIPLLVTVGCGFWIGKIYGRNDAQFSAFDLLGAIIGSFALMGVTEICVALNSRDSNMAVVGAIFIIIAFRLLFFIAEIGARMAALGVDVLEGTLGIGKTFATALMTMDMKGALKEAAKHPVNISDQEKYVGYVREARRFGEHVLYPSLLLTILLPLPYVFALNMVTGIALYLSREYLESKWVETIERQKLRARMLEVLTVGLIALNFLKYLWPHREEIIAFFPEANGIFTWAASFLYSLYSVLNIWWMLGGLVFAIISAALLHPGEGEGTFHKARAGMAACMVLVQFACILAILFTVFVRAHDKSSLASLKQASVMVDTMTPPSAQVVTDKTSGSPHVVITWKDFPQAEQYIVERGRSMQGKDMAKKGEEPAFAKVALPVLQGMGMMEDPGPFTPGEKYVYRLVAKLPFGELKPSDPVRVLIPVPLPPEEKADDKKSPLLDAGTAATANVAPAVTHEDTDVNPGLDAYCSRHKGSVACTNM